MKASFKQFSQFVDLPEQELSEEQLTEIFSTIFNKMDEIKRKKREEEIKKKLLDKKNALYIKQQELKNKQFADAKAAAETGSLARRSRADSYPTSAAGGRAAERTWATAAAAGLNR